MTVPRRVFGWHTQIPGCAYYRVQLPLRTLTNALAVGWDQKWACQYGSKLPIPAELDAALAAGHGTAPTRIAAHMAERFDVVIGQQIGAGGTGADAIWQAMARHRDRTGGPMLVLETDDDLMAMHGGHLDEAKREIEQRADAYRRAIQVADVVTVTTPGLAEAIRRQADPAGPIKIIPNYIDQAMFEVPGGGQHVPSGRPVVVNGVRYKEGGGGGWPGPERMLIGWGGSSTHQRDFALAWPALRRLLSQDGGVCFASMGVMHSVDDPALAKLETRKQLAGLRWMDMDREPWRDYWTRLGWYDIGLAPLEINQFNRAKSWIKILEYCAMGVPFVASASPEYERFVSTNPDRVDPHKADIPGILVDGQTEHGWYGALRAITKDWAELCRMQARARIYARQFTIQDHIGEWAAALADR